MSGAHAPLAPSAASRWIECPGSVRLCEGRDDSSSEAAKEGTFAHEIAAECLELGFDAADFIGTVREVEGSEFCFDESMAEHVQTYLDFVTELVGDDGRLYVEAEVKWLDDVYGTTDAAVLSSDHLELDVADLKFGKGVLVSAIDNAQARVYALAAIKTLCVEPPKIIRCHIVQPRHHLGGCSTEELTWTELKNWGITAQTSAAATRFSSSPFKAGDHCRWCLAKADCPALRKASTSIAQSVFTDESLQTKRKDAPKPGTLSDEEISTILDAAPTVESWLKAVRVEAKRRALDGGNVPEYKLVETRSNRKWIDEAAVKRAYKDRGISPYGDAKLKSPAQAEKDLGAQVVSKLAHTVSTGTTLVPSDDKRPHYNPAAVFGEPKA